MNCLFACSVNDPPLLLVVWRYEQKAVAILLALLHLGIKGIRLEPSLPAFITPNVPASHFITSKSDVISTKNTVCRGYEISFSVLVEKVGIKPTGDVDEDLADKLN